MGSNPSRKRPDRRRADLDNQQIALSWISGKSLLDLSIEYDCTQGTISNRLREARDEFPDLPWGERQVKIGTGGCGITQYLAMNDGKPGESRISEGSVIRSSTLRRRGC